MGRSPTGRLSSRRWESVAVEAKAAARWRCAECGRATVELEAHHLVPVSVDPSRAFDLANIRPLCRGCHVAEHRDETPEQRAWRELVYDIL